MTRTLQLAVGLLLLLPIAVYAGVSLRDAAPGQPERVAPVVLPGSDDTRAGRDGGPRRTRGNDTGGSDRGDDHDRDDRGDVDDVDAPDEADDRDDEVRVVTPRPTPFDDDGDDMADDDGDDEREDDGGGGDD